MKELFFLKPRRTLPTVMLLLCATVGSTLPGQAQQTDAKHPVEAIKMPVHLRLGATTVGKLAAIIGDQTVLNIDTDPILSTHRIVVEMDGISAETALQTLADLNGWKITHPLSGHYHIRPIAAPLPKQIAEIPIAFRTALPMDFRRYLGLEVAKDDLPQAPARGQFNDSRLRYLQEKEDQRQITFRHNQLLEMATASLTRDLPLQLKDGNEHSYAALSPEQKDYMVTLLVVNKLHLLNSDLLHGKLKPFQRDYNTAELTLKDGRMLVVGATTNLNGGTMYEAFGAPIQALQPPPLAKP
ncbi:MAG: hypothetical protein JWL77_2675 [Chthonomonadaceae bacterium]|nr:hypothetical protein [Chthonomonadaceae bacterium]